MVDYGHIIKEYAEDNDISNAEAYSRLHCDCEDEINYEVSEDGGIYFDTISDYIKWYKLNKRRLQNENK